MPQSAWLLALQLLYPRAPPCYFDAMPYEVTSARKRPQTFEQLAGQNFVAATLEKSLETGRIAHAYLFAGPRGCGKTSTARILAKALNCEKGPASQPCGVCDSCKAITSGSSLDVIEIDGASNTSVDNVRQIKDEVIFPPNSGRYKIYIIDEVHMLSTSAFNALLKTIEEPPPYVIFMFATTEPHKVPATIKSRCQQFNFRLVDAETIVGLLATVVVELDVEAEPEALLWIARESGGSIRDAYTLFDQVLSFAEGRITAALIREKLGLVGQDRMNALLGSFVAGNTQAALASLDDILSGGVSPEQFVADMVEYCRALLLIVNGVVKEGLLGAPLASFDLAIPEALGEDKVERLLSIFLGAYRNLKESVDPRYELDLAVAKASHIAEYVSPAELAKAVGTLRRFVERGVKPVSPSAPAYPSAAGRVAPPYPQPLPASGSQAPVSGFKAMPASEPLPNPENLPDLKKTLVAEIKKSNVLLGTTLEKSGFLHHEGSVLHVAATSRMGYDLLKRFSGIIAEVLSQKIGAAWSIEFEFEGEGKAKGKAIQDQVRPVQGIPPAFNDGAQLQGLKVGMAEATPPAQEPDLSQRDREAVGLVERYFKGSVIGYVKAPAVEQVSGKAETLDFQTQDQS